MKFSHNIKNGKTNFERMHAKSIAELKNSGYRSKTIREELRQNLIEKIHSGDPVFKGIFGYENTVIPDVERAILSGHNILFLGLRGQAKTKMARLLPSLLDEFIPIVEGSEINDDPFKPISKYARDLVKEMGDRTPISWIHREERYVEKLATPDVSIADLIGDLDPIKAAQKQLSFDNEYAIHYGLIPRANRSLFVINELPDLQARIQVSLFNILEEMDLQIRGFKIKLPLDLYFVFTANPEDYTQRGNIITPLKDRIESQILTHYPEELETALKITTQEAKIPEKATVQIKIPGILERIVEDIAFVARESELVDEKSGVSARLSISAYELLYSAVERRLLFNKEKNGTARLTDLLSIVPAITGKMELVYEGEQVGLYEVALSLINEAISRQVRNLFPKVQQGKQKLNPLYKGVYEWFSKGNELMIHSDSSQASFKKQLEAITDVDSLTKEFPKDQKLFATECILHLIASENIIQREWMDNRIIFKDQLASMLNDLNIDSN